MKTKALVVDDDEFVAEALDNILFSMGHSHVWVTNQSDAQKKLKSERYHYVLLDWQIPAKPIRGFADKAFGTNLLDFIEKIKPPRRPPVIMMTSNTGECLELSAELMAKGVVAFVAKPFENKGRALAQVISKVLNNGHQPVPDAPPARGGPQTFQGGELVLSKDRAELCGVKIMSDKGTGQALEILGILSKKDRSGRYVYCSAEELTRAIGAHGIMTVTSCIKTIRRNVRSRLREHRNLACQLNDVIDHNEQGYFLRDWITVRVA